MSQSTQCLGSFVPLAMFYDHFPIILEVYVMDVYSTKLPLFWIANPSHEAGNSDKSWKISGLTHSQVAPCFTSQHLSPLSSVLEFWLKTSQENMTWFHIIIKFVVLFIGHMSNHSLRFISHLLTHSLTNRICRICRQFKIVKICRLVKAVNVWVCNAFGNV